MAPADAPSYWGRSASEVAAYRAELVVCRDELCSRVARELNASCDAAFEGRSFAGFAMDMAWGSLTSVFDMGKEQPQYEEPQAAQEEAIAQANELRIKQLHELAEEQSVDSEAGEDLEEACMPD